MAQRDWYITNGIIGRQSIVEIVVNCLICQPRLKQINILAILPEPRSTRFNPGRQPLLPGRHTVVGHTFVGGKDAQAGFRVPIPCWYGRASRPSCARGPH